MSAIVLGRVNWGLRYEKNFHRDYGITWLVETSDPLDGPAIVANAIGLPSPGSVWQQGNDYDPWAYCWPDWTIEPVIDKEPSCLWTVGQTFSTKPLQLCMETQYQNPLQEPPKINGGWTKYTEELRLDRFGYPVKSSSHETIRGSYLEFDENRPNAQIEYNTLFFPTRFYAPFMNTVNDSPIWGFEPRCVKLANFSWQRQLYGACFFYYTVKVEFEVNTKTFDRDIPDVGHRVLMGHSPSTKVKPPLDPNAPDQGEGAFFGALMKDNPANFEPWSSSDNEKLGQVFLKGDGTPVVSGNMDEVHKIHVERYEGRNFHEFGFPPLLF